MRMTFTNHGRNCKLKLRTSSRLTFAQAVVNCCETFTFTTSCATGKY